MIKNILVISNHYPSPIYPVKGTFVYQLVKAFTRQGIKCTVINPIPITLKLLRNWSSAIVKLNEGITVLHPKYLSMSDKEFFKFNTYYLTKIFYQNAVKQSIKQLKEKPDIVYGHFLYPDGGVVIHLGKQFSVPSFVAVGESSFWSIRPIGFDKASYEYRDVTGIIAVGNHIKKALTSKLKIPEEKIGVFPNATDLTIFYPRDRLQIRRKYRFPIDLTIIAFVGKFDERKGPHRVLEAIQPIPNTGAIFIGEGKIPIEGEKVLYKGTVPHMEIPQILSSADIFVLPTLAEGSCNAIVEALACGLPVITSKGEYNDNLVDENVSMRVNPQNIEEIRAAIKWLIRHPEERQRLSQNALKRAKKYFDINLRAKKILSWMERIISQYKRSIK